MIKLIIILIIAIIGMLIIRWILNNKWRSITEENFLSDKYYEAISHFTKIFERENISRFKDAKVLLYTKVLCFIVFAIIVYFFEYTLIWILIGLYMILTCIANRLLVMSAAKNVVDDPKPGNYLILYGKNIVYFYQIFLTILFYVFVVIK